MQGSNKNQIGITLVPQNTVSPSVNGDMRYNSGTNKVEVYDGAVDALVTEAGTATLTNKTISGNTATNLVNGSGTFDFNSSGTITAPNGTDTLAGISLTQVLTNKTLSGNTATNLVNGSGTFDFNSTGTITAPNATDTLVGKATTDVLTNKTLSGNTATNLVNGSGTFDFNSTGTITAPNATDTLVGKATTDVLTNKTLSGNTATNLVNGSGTFDFNSSGTLTAPNVTDTLTANAATQSISNKQMAYSSATDSTTTGSAATLQAFTTSIVRLTNTSLVSVSGIPGGASGLQLIIENKTTATITINNEDAGATAANRIQTGTGASVSMPNNSSLSFSYDSTSSRWQLVSIAGSSASGSGKNYLSAILTSTSSGALNPGNGNFENGTTSGWGTFGTTLTGVIPTGTIGASGGSITLSTVSGSSALAGGYSLSAAYVPMTAGDGFISSAFNIDSEDQGKVLTLSAYYTVHAGSNTNLSGTSSNSIAMYIYDVTNSAWIQPAGVYGMTQSSGVGRITGTFQTTSNSTQYRLAFLTINTTIFSDTLYFDDFFVGPQTAPIGPVASDWASYTPTSTQGFGTTTSNEFYWRRVGDSVDLLCKFVAGTVAASEARISLPSSFTSADSSKIPSIRTVGSGVSSQTNQNYNVFIETSVTYVTFGRNFWSGGQSTISKINGNTAFSTGDTFEFFAQGIPITGLSSNLQMSNDTDTRVVAFAAVSVTATVTSSYSDLSWTTVNNDTHGAYSSPTYTIPVSGFYDFSGQVFVSATTIAAGNNFTIGLLNNTSSSTLRETEYVYEGTNTTNQAIQFNYKSIFLNAGTAIKMQIKSNTTSPVITASATENFWSVNRQSGPSVVAATESVNARYYNTATSISGSLTTISWTTKDFDSHNAMSSGTYTIPVSGKYQVNAVVAFTAASSAAGNAIDFQIQKNSTSVSEIAPVYQGTQVGLPVFLSDEISCVAGDTLRVQVSSGATTPSITSSNTKNFISISRTGN